MENLLDYLLSVIFWNAEDVDAIGRYYGEDSFHVTSECNFIFTKSEIKKIRSMFAARWRYMCDSDRRKVYNFLKRMK